MEIRPTVGRGLDKMDEELKGIRKRGTREVALDLDITEKGGGEAFGREICVESQ